MAQRTRAEPYRIRAIEPSPVTTFEFRLDRIAKAGYNTFLLETDDIEIDLLTDAGMSAISYQRGEGWPIGDPGYAGSHSFEVLKQAVRDVYGLEYVIPLHLGRIGERLLLQTAVSRGQYVPTNKYFGISRYDADRTGGLLRDCISDTCLDSRADLPFKGNLDIAKLVSLAEQGGPDKISFILVAPCINMAGGQPMSMENLVELADWAGLNSIPLVLDGTRVSENAYFIQQREPGYSHKSIRAIIGEMMSHIETCVVSSKKASSILSTGGFIATRNLQLFESTKERLVADEGLPSYGGLSGQNMELLARSIREGISDGLVHSHVDQVQYLGRRLTDAGVPVILPIGGHAVFLDANKFLANLPQDQFRAQSLAAAIYVDSGVRCLERGVVSAGRDLVSGENRIPDLELVRLAVPRFAYTYNHMNVVAESCAHLHGIRESIGGLRLVYEPKRLRFFEARFEPTGGKLIMEDRRSSTGYGH